MTKSASYVCLCSQNASEESIFEGSLTRERRFEQPIFAIRGTRHANGSAILPRKIYRILPKTQSEWHSLAKTNIEASSRTKNERIV